MTEPRPVRSRTDSLRDTYRKQLLDSIGGWSGALITAIPTVVFVIVNVALRNLAVSIGAAVGAALVLTGYRFARKQPVQQALSGLLGVAVAAVVAGLTGQARGYFLVGIWLSFAYAVPFAISLLVRRPLIGVLWEFLDPSPGTRGHRPEDGDAGDHDDSGDVSAATSHDAGAESPAWYRCRPLFSAYMWSTFAAFVVFLARGVVQLLLYGENRTGWLAFARIAMGYPLFVAAAGFSVLAIRRARHRMAAKPA